MRRHIDIWLSTASPMIIAETHSKTRMHGMGRMDVENRRGKGDVIDVLHTCTHRKSYYVNTTCCHAVYTRPYCETDTFGAHNQLQARACAGRRGGAPRGVMAQGRFYDRDAFSRPDLCLNADRNGLTARGTAT